MDAERLARLKFRNWDAIPRVVDEEEWSGLDTPGVWVNSENRGCYSNWFAVTNPRGLAPTGFQLPLTQEWRELVQELSGDWSRVRALPKGGATLGVGYGIEIGASERLSVIRPSRET